MWRCGGSVELRQMLPALSLQLSQLNSRPSVATGEIRVRTSIVSSLLALRVGVCFCQLCCSRAVPNARKSSGMACFNLSTTCG
jgi:hypothetical protein